MLALDLYRLQPLSNETETDCFVLKKKKKKKKSVATYTDLSVFCNSKIPKLRFKKITHTPSPSHHVRISKLLCMLCK